MNILVPVPNALGMEVAEALEKQSPFFPFARVCDVKIETFPKQLGRVALTISCIIYPGPVFRTEANISLFRSEDTCQRVMTKMLQAIASMDIRTMIGDTPESGLTIIQRGGPGDPNMNGELPIDRGGIT